MESNQFIELRQDTVALDLLFLRQLWKGETPLCLPALENSLFKITSSYQSIHVHALIFRGTREVNYGEITLFKSVLVTSRPLCKPITGQVDI